MKNKQFKNQNVKNKKVKSYVKWFEFAQKTRNENNQKKDFDDIFTEMIRKLSHKSLDVEDLSFLEYYRLLEGEKDVWESQYKEEGKQIGLEKAQQQIKQAENKAKQAEDKSILALIQNTDFSEEAIANMLEVTIEQMQQLRHR